MGASFPPAMLRASVRLRQTSPSRAGGYWQSSAFGGLSHDVTGRIGLPKVGRIQRTPFADATILQDTVVRPPAADSCDASVGVRRVVVGLSCSTDSRSRPGRRLRAMVVSPARMWVAGFVGERWPGGLVICFGRRNPGLPPGATIVRPPAADSCDASVGVRRVVVGLSCSNVWSWG